MDNSGDLALSSTNESTMLFANTPIIKSEPLDFFNYNQEIEYEITEPSEEIALKKKQIIENETTVYRCQECDEIFQKYPQFRLHRTQHSIEKRTCKICNVLFQGIAKVSSYNIYLFSFAESLKMCMV